MYQQNRPQMPMPGMMQGVSPLSGLTDGDEIMAEEQRMGRNPASQMGRNPASQAEEMLRQQPAADRYRMEQFQRMFDADTQSRLQDAYKDLREYSEEQEKNKYDPQRRFDQLR